MYGAHICRLEAASLPPALSYEAKLQVKSPEIHSQLINSEWAIGKMVSHTPAIWHSICPPKGNKGQHLSIFWQLTLFWMTRLLQYIYHMKMS